MTYYEKYHGSKDWLEKIKIMNLYHRMQDLTNKKWGYRDTAKYFDVALGLVSENLNLAMELDRIKHFSNRQRAVIYLNMKKGELK